MSIVSLRLEAICDRCGANVKANRYGGGIGIHSVEELLDDAGWKVLEDNSLICDGHDDEDEDNPIPDIEPINVFLRPT